jgi:uncharacterized protein YybS (DUF2232 family)
MSELGKSLIIFGIIIALLGCILMLSGKLPWLGRLPGDINIRRENFSFHFPLTTCIIISIIVSFLLYIFRR